MKLTQRNMFAYHLYITIAHNSSRVILLVILVSKVHCIRFRIKCNNDKETNFLYSVIIELSKGLNNCFLYYGMATFYFCFICINTFYNRCKLLWQKCTLIFYWWLLLLHADLFYGQLKKITLKLFLYNLLWRF